MKSLKEKLKEFDEKYYPEKPTAKQCGVAYPSQMEPWAIQKEAFYKSRIFFSSYIKEILEGIDKIIKETCDEQTMPRIWNLNKDLIDRFIKTLPVYEPKSGEEYQVGLVRGETWGALKIKIELQSKIKGIIS